MFRLPSLVRLLDECQSSFERLLAPPANLETLPTEERTIAEVSFLGMLRKKMTPGGMELNRSFFVFDVFFLPISEVVQDQLGVCMRLISLLGRNAGV